MPLLTHPFFERWYGKVIGASVMAQLGSLPVAIGAFGTLYPYALLTNVLVVPLFPILVTVCLLAAPLTFLLPVAKGLLTGFIWLATAVGNLPAAEVGIGAISGEVAVFIGCGLAVAYLLLRRQKE
jgi:predicted membrane metal-binding protein